MDTLLARWLIQLRLKNGRLPRNGITDLTDSPGDGQSWCDGCGASLTQAEKVVTGLGEEDWRSIRLHRECFRIWETERLVDARRA